MVIEALAAGTPVLVTRHAGLPEMISEGVEGAFVSPASPSDIADAAEILQADWLTRSEAARQRFKLAYSPAVVRERWLALLDTL